MELLITINSILLSGITDNHLQYLALYGITDNHLRISCSLYEITNNH